MPAPLPPPSASQALRRVYASEWWIFTATAISLLPLVLFPHVFRGRTEGSLHPHGYCYIWDTALVTSHVAADLAIGVAYVAISVTLGYLVYRVRHLLPFHWMFLAFGLFILTCGATHFMDVWTLWFADFWASAALKIVTAVASLATAIALPPLIPQIVRLLHAANVSEERHQELQSERREREAVEAESRAKDLFLATLSHELRTPLNAVAGWAQVLETTPHDQLRDRAIEAIQRNIALQKRLVEDMLDVSAILTGRLALTLKRIDIGPVVRHAVDAIRSAARDKNLQIEEVLPATEVIVEADEARLQQVLANLLSNAVKFTPAGGRVEVVVNVAREEAVLLVRDTGEGVEPMLLPRIFDSFVQGNQLPTRSTGGLGLGLAIVKYLVQQHGGTVHARSEGQGRGTEVEVRLPLSAKGPAARGDAAAPRPH